MHKHLLVNVTLDNEKAPGKDTTGKEVEFEGWARGLTESFLKWRREP